MLTLDGVVAADSLVVGSSTLRLSDAESSYEGKYQFSIKLLLLTLSAHAREGYSSHFVCHSVTLSVSLSLFDFGEDAVFRVETYISTF